MTCNFSGCSTHETCLAVYSTIIIKQCPNHSKGPWGKTIRHKSGSPSPRAWQLYFFYVGRSRSKKKLFDTPMAQISEMAPQPETHRIPRP